MDISWVYQQHPPNQPQHKAKTQKSPLPCQCHFLCTTPTTRFLLHLPRNTKKNPRVGSICVLLEQTKPLRKPHPQKRHRLCHVNPKSTLARNPLKLKCPNFNYYSLKYLTNILDFFLNVYFLKVRVLFSPYFLLISGLPSAGMGCQCSPLRG